jgi:hypothetical protein
MVVIQFLVVRLQQAEVEVPMVGALELLAGLGVVVHILEPQQAQVLLGREIMVAQVLVVLVVVGEVQGILDLLGCQQGLVVQVVLDYNLILLAHQPTMQVAGEVQETLLVGQGVQAVAQQA